VLGCNDKGQLGLGHCNEVSAPTGLVASHCVAELGSLGDSAAKHVKLIPGPGHVVAGLTHNFWYEEEEDIMFGCGANSYGQTGAGMANGIFSKIPARLGPMCQRKIRQLACGANFTWFLTHKDEVLSVGSNGFGQLGLDHFNDEHMPRFIQQLCGQEITDLACGDQFAWAYSQTTGEVYSCGENFKGQLGLGHNENMKLPRRVDHMCGRGVTMIDCGMQFVYILAAAMEVYVVGSNFFGKLGIGKNGGWENIPRHCQFFSGLAIVQVACGSSFAWLLAKSGGVYSVGGNLNGELGLGTKYNEDRPKKVDFFHGKQIRSLIPGKDCIWAISETHQIYSCGKNDHGQLGLGDGDGVVPDRKNRSIPVHAPAISNRDWYMCPHKGCFHGDTIYMCEMTLTDEERGQRHYEENKAAMPTFTCL